MKRILLALLVAVLLAGCAETGSGGAINFDNELSTLEKYTEAFATGGGNIEEFTEFIESFNGKLSVINSKDKDITEFVGEQRKANELRLEGFAEMDFDKINDSTAHQARALELYNGFKDAN